MKKIILFLTSICVCLYLVGCEEKHVHNYVKTTIEANCVEGGLDRYECECGDAYEENIVRALGHSFSDWQLDEEKLIQYRECDRCGLKEDESNVNRLLLESHFDIEFIWEGTTPVECQFKDKETGEVKFKYPATLSDSSIQEPSCNGESYNSYTATAVIKEGLIIGDTLSVKNENIEHSYGEWEYNSNHRCDVNMRFKVCSICGDCHTEDYVFEITPNVTAEPVYDEETDSVKFIVTCDNCFEGNYTFETITSGLLYEEGVQATHTEDGYYISKAVIETDHGNFEYQKEVIIPAIGHSCYYQFVPMASDKVKVITQCDCFEENVVEYMTAELKEYIKPTCTSYGYETYEIEYGYDNDSFKKGFKYKLDKVAHNLNDNNVCVDCGATASEGLSFEYTSEYGYMVTGIGTCKDKDIIIPKIYKNYYVAGIKEWSFGSDVNIDSVSIDVGIVASYAFSRCNITSLALGKNVKIIGDFAFTGYKVQTEEDVFYKFNTNDIQKVGAYTFQYAGYEVLSVGKGLYDYKAQTFGNDTLVFVEVDEENTKYDSRNDCGVLMNTLYNSLVQGSAAGIIPEGTKKIEDNAFYLANSQGKMPGDLIIPESVEYIGEGAFAFANRGSADLFLSKNVKSVSGLSFYGLNTITVDEENPYLDSRNNCNAVVDSVTNELLLISKSMTEIPEGVEILGSNIRINIPNLVIPNTVRKIYYDSFYAYKEEYNIYFDGTLAEWLNIEFVESTFPLGISVFVKDENGEYYSPTYISIDFEINNIGWNVACFKTLETLYISDKVNKQNVHSYLYFKGLTIYTDFNKDDGDYFYQALNEVYYNGEWEFIDSIPTVIIE